MVSPEEKLRPIVEARRRREERLANDSRTTDELLALARLEMQDDNSDKTWDAVAVLQYRATDEIFRLAQSFCESNHPTEQALGATLLGQNLVEQKDFPDEKFDILFHILETSQDSDVLSAACFALGHLRDERAIGPLLKLKDNPDNDVRFSVVHGLWTYEDEAAIGALIDLSKDADDDVRDW